MNNRITQAYSFLTESQKEILYLFGYFVISYVSWSITNTASAYASQWLGELQFGDFSFAIRIAHNMAHLFVMGQEATLLVYLSKYQHEPQKQTGLIRWIVRSTFNKTLMVLWCVSLALLLNINISLLGHTLVNRVMWIAFAAIPFVVICGIYERFFLFLRQFFVSFIPRGIFFPLFFMGFIHLVYQKTPFSETALWLYTLSFLLAGLISILQGYYSGFSLTKEDDQSDIEEWKASGLFYTISTIIIKSTPSMAFLFLRSLGPDEIAIAHFSALCNLIYGFHMLTKPFDSYLKPFVARLYADNDIEKLQSTINFVNSIRWSIILFLFLRLALFGYGFLDAYGESYIAAKNPLMVYAFLSFIQYLGQPAHEMLNYTGYQKELSIIMTAQFFMICAFSVMLIPTLGLWGAVIAQGIPCVIATLLSSRYLYRKTKLKAYFLF